jgi:hypothetical protein
MMKLLLDSAYRSAASLGTQNFDQGNLLQEAFSCKKLAIPVEIPSGAMHLGPWVEMIL